LQQRQRVLRISQRTERGRPANVERILVALCCESVSELVESGVQRQRVGEHQAGREVTARAAAGPEGRVKGRLGHVVALGLSLRVGQGDQPGQGAPDPRGGERGEQRSDPLVDQARSFGVEAGRVDLADDVESSSPPDPTCPYGIPEKRVPIDAVEDLADECRAAAGSDPEECGDFEAEVFGNRGRAVGTVIDELLGCLTEGVLVNSVVGKTKAMDRVELQGLRCDLRVLRRAERVEQASGARRRDDRRLLVAGLVRVFDYMLDVISLQEKMLSSLALAAAIVNGNACRGFGVTYPTRSASRHGQTSSPCELIRVPHCARLDVSIRFFSSRRGTCDAALGGHVQ
jgi:hypothetical protein